jgi:hypothetical protein
MRRRSVTLPLLGLVLKDIVEPLPKKFAIDKLLPSGIKSACCVDAEFKTLIPVSSATCNLALGEVVPIPTLLFVESTFNVFVSTVKSPLTVNPSTSSTVIFLLPITTSIDDPLGGAALNVSVVPLIE